MFYISGCLFFRATQQSADRSAQTGAGATAGRLAEQLPPPEYQDTVDTTWGAVKKFLKVVLSQGNPGLPAIF